MGDFQVGDMVRVKSEVDLNRLFSSVAWPTGRIEGTVVGKGLNGCHYVDIPAFRTQSPTGYWPIYGHELETVPNTPSNMEILQNENKRLREALEDIATSMKYATIETPTDEIVSILQAWVTYLRETAKQALEQATAPADAAEGANHE